MIKRTSENRKGGFARKTYASPAMKKTAVALEEGICKSSDVIQDDPDKKADISISEMDQANDGFTFTFDMNE